MIGINEIGYGLSGAIPSEIASEVSKQLIAGGRVTRTWIGASFQPVLKSTSDNKASQGVLEQLNFGGPGGALCFFDSAVAVNAEGPEDLVRASGQEFWYGGGIVGAVLSSGG